MLWKSSTVCFAFLQLALFGLSTMETIASVHLLLGSEGLYVGGIYAGIPCAISSLLGLFALCDGDHKYWTFIACILLNAICFILSIVATALISQLSIQLGKLSSCAYYDSPPERQCQSDVSNLSCHGQSSSFYFSALCAVEAQPQYHDLPSYYSTSSYNIVPSPGICWCVESSLLNECVTYSQVPNCSYLFTRFPEYVDNCFVYACPLIALTGLLFCFRDPRIVNISATQLSLLGQDTATTGGIPLATSDGTRVTLRHLDLSRDTDPSVMMVAADTYLSPEFVQTNAEYTRTSLGYMAGVCTGVIDTSTPTSDSDGTLVVTIEENGAAWVTRQARMIDEPSRSSRSNINHMNDRNISSQLLAVEFLTSAEEDAADGSSGSSHSHHSQSPSSSISSSDSHTETATNGVARGSSHLMHSWVAVTVQSMQRIVRSATTATNSLSAGNSTFDDIHSLVDLDGHIGPIQHQRVRTSSTSSENQDEGSNANMDATEANQPIERSESMQEESSHLV